MLKQQPSRFDKLFRDFNIKQKEIIIHLKIKKKAPNKYKRTYLQNYHNASAIQIHGNRLSFAYF